MTELQISREFLKRRNQAAGLANPYSSVTQGRTAHLILNHLSRIPLKQASEEAAQRFHLRETQSSHICISIKYQSLSHVRLFVTPWTVAHQSPLFMGFSRQEYWSGLPCPLPGDLPNPWVEPLSPVSPAFAGIFFTTEPPGKYSQDIDLDYY